jgi:hypothetical protein
LVSLGLPVGLAFGGRAISTAITSLIPGAGQIINVATAGLLTLALGLAATWFYIYGIDVDANTFRKMFEDIKEEYSKMRKNTLDADQPKVTLKLLSKFGFRKPPQ